LTLVFQFDTQSGRLYETEHGPRGGDELNIIVAHKNYGWPVITYGMDYSGAYVSPYTQRPGLEQPVIYWTPSIAPSGLAMYRGDKFPAWKGDLFVGAAVPRIALPFENPAPRSVCVRRTTRVLIDPMRRCAGALAPFVYNRHIVSCTPAAN
jgi:glucose/arabinose dehydrogenase